MSKKLGVEVLDSSPTCVKVQRVTKETEITAEVNLEKVSLKTDSGLVFLDHMIEMLGWYACMSIGVVEQPIRKLTHTISEDAGITLGRAFRELHEHRMKTVGVQGMGFGVGILDEAQSNATLSIEGRRNAYIAMRAPGSKIAKVEDMAASELVAFIEGFAQGLGATIHVNMIKGKDPHHCWETVFRALGLALSQALQENAWRIGAIVGVKGTLE